MGKPRGPYKKREKKIQAEVCYIYAPSEVPVGVLSFALFGKSPAAVAREIMENKDGKWNVVYEDAEAENT